jgi:hypothetical protein
MEYVQKYAGFGATIAIIHRLHRFLRFKSAQSVDVSLQMLKNYGYIKRSQFFSLFIALLGEWYAGRL